MLFVGGGWQPRWWQMGWKQGDQWLGMARRTGHFVQGAFDVIHERLLAGMPPEE
jgi:hypothetical protein